MNVLWNTKDEPLALAEALASDIHEQINDCISVNGMAVIALSGGSTPKPFFAKLANKNINWSKVVITLVDERCVDENHALSNAAFMRTHLLSKLDPTPTFIPLYLHDSNQGIMFKRVLDQYYAATNSSAAAPRNFDIVVLGMGGDGHTASYFPDADNIDELLDINNEAPLLACHSPSTQVPRLTWSLKMLLRCSYLALHFTGKDKRQVFDRAQSVGETGAYTELPVRSVIFQNHTPLNVYYSDSA